MKKLIIVAIIAFNAISIFAQTQKYDIYSDTPPKGWEVQNGDNAKVFTKIDKATNSLGIIMLYPSIDSSGNAEDDFKYVWKQIVQNGFGASANPEMESSEHKGFTMVNGGELIKYEGVQALAMLTVLSGKGKVISVLTITNEQSYASATENLLDSLTINATDSPKAPAKSLDNSNSPKSTTSGKLSGGGIVGVWVGNGNPNLATDRIKWNWRVFFSDGTAFVVIPDEGLYDFTATSDFADYIGKFNYSNGKGKILYGNGSQFSDAIKFYDANTLDIGGIEYRKCVPLSGTFDGTFSYYLPNDNIINTLPVGEKPRITFNQNGQFRDEGLFATYLKDYSKDANYNKAGSGTYKIVDYSMILKFNDGRERVLSFTVPYNSPLKTAKVILLGRLQLNKV